MSKGSLAPITWGLSVGSMFWSARAVSPIGEDATIVKYRLDKSIPPSVLLGWITGEPARLDCWMPPHPRGTASHWPLDAIVDCEKGSGRFPLAAAWTGRLDDLSWRWKPDGEYRQLGSLDAICVGIATLARIHAHNESIAIVIPNDFKQREQQRLLDACRIAGVDASLIWLPVAAVLAWLSDNSSTLPTPLPDSVERIVVPVVHADWGSIRCSTLSLVNRTDEHGSRWMPARSRPSVSDWSRPGFGWNFAAPCNTANAHRVWRTLFGFGDNACTTEADSNSNVLECIAKWRFWQSSPTSLDSQLAEHLEQIEPRTAIIIVGDFADQVSRGPKVSRLLVAEGAYVAGGRDGEDFLARGAAIFARDRLQGRTSYLDTLPNLELFVDRGSHYDWMRLLGDVEQFVSGGQEWALPSPIEGLAVRRGASSIKLVVAHDEYKGVRELQIPLEHPAEVDLGASLRVSATPAQGNARLLLTMEATNGIPSRSILANWEKMTQLFDKDNKTPLDKNKFEQSRPKAFPNIRPRRADLGRWISFSNRARRFLNEVRDASQVPGKSRELGRLLESIRLVAGCSPISSEGCAPRGGDQELINNVASILFEYLKRPCGANRQNRVGTKAIKTLALMSVSLEGLDGWICDAVGRSGNIDEPLCMIAGNCLRSPDAAFVFVDRLLKHIPFSNQGRLLNYQMQALGRLLSQRKDIMRTMPAESVNHLVEECLKVFEGEIKRDNLAWLFEHSGLVVVYSLRYRMYKPTFLDPNCELAMRAKRLFEVAIEKLTQRLKSSGQRYGLTTVRPERIDRLKSALQQLIDYIDKRGEGDILLALDE